MKREQLRILQAEAKAAQELLAESRGYFEEEAK